MLSKRNATVQSRAVGTKGTMRVYKLEVMVIDLDNIGEENIVLTLQSTRYPNRCISPEVKRVEMRDCGQWHDDHPLNKMATANAEYHRLFDSPPST